MLIERMRTIVTASLMSTLLAVAVAPVSDAVAASVRGVGSDTATVGAGGSASAGTVVNVPIFVRDESLSPLGLDQPPGNRIQGLAFRVDFPLGTVTGASIAPFGITASLTPLFAPFSNFSANSVNYLVSYEETTNLIPFTLDGAPPGNAVAQLSITLAPNAPVGVYAITFNAASELSNQAGTVAENVSNGGLALVNGSFGVTSNAARGLYAYALSASSIQLTWFDPNLIETGFRIERSTDGISWTPVQTVGPDVTSFIDTPLPANNLRYYRLITVTAGGDGHASNRATASTFPATATNICVNPQTINRRWARAPAAAYRGPDWGLVYQDRDDGTRDQVYFQLLEGTTLANLGPRVQISETTTAARAPAIGWNGTNYAVTWFESVVAGPGSPLDIGLRFAQLDGSGAILRTPVRIPVTPASASETRFDGGVVAQPHWDGTHWGLFTTRVTPPFNATIDYRRLQPNGSVVVGPAAVATAPDAFLTRVEAAWNASTGEYGVVWVRRQSNTWDLQFQRVEESNGLPLLGAPASIASVVSSGGFAGPGIVVNPAGGWLVAWTECDATECAAYTRRVAADGTPDVGGRVRVSAAPPSDEADLRLVARPSGFAVLTENFETGASEVLRYHLDATGAPDGFGPTVVSTQDGRNSGLLRVASDGTRALVVWNESASTLEVAGRLSDGVSGALGSEVAFTSGHDPGNTTGVPASGQSPRIVPVSSGFFATWLELDSGTSLIHGRLYGGTGALFDNYAPFSANATNGRPGVATFGDNFAVAWRSGGNLRFTRISSTGTVRVAETVVAAGTGPDQTVELGWDGENFVAVWSQGGYRYLRIGANGTAIGTPQVLPLGAISPTNTFRMAWMGDAWALLFKSDADQNMYYARFANDGSVPLAPTLLSNGFIPLGATGGDPNLIYNGLQLAAAWNEISNPGLDPPGYQGRFTLLNRDGTEVFADLAPNPAPTGSGRQQLYYGAGRFHLVYGMESHFQNGMRELDLDLVAGGATGTPGRFLANRHNTATGVAHNGVSLGIAWYEPATLDVHVQTDACLADPSPPTCPIVSIASSNNEVRLSWPPVTDAQSGLWRYHVFRDGRILTELPTTTTSFDDSGYDPAVIHTYQVRAMNRAFKESVGCPTLSFSTVVGDANGNGMLDVADIFYLINFTLASGPPPLGDADANSDGAVSVTDVFFLINFFYGGGPPPTSIERH